MLNRALPLLALLLLAALPSEANESLRVKCLRAADYPTLEERLECLETGLLSLGETDEGILAFYSGCRGMYAQHDFTMPKERNDEQKWAAVYEREACYVHGLHFLDSHPAPKKAAALRRHRAGLILSACTATAFWQMRARCFRDAALTLSLEKPRKRCSGRFFQDERDFERFAACMQGEFENLAK